MEKIAVSTLRENLSIYLKKVQSGQAITITTRGREMAILVPVKKKRKLSTKMLRDLAKSAVIGDIVSPIDENWEVMK